MHPLHTDDPALERFPALDDDDAHAALRACCASPAWVTRIWSGRPYGSRAELLDTAEAACRDLEDRELDTALAGHPRIGDRAAGSSTEARWSRREQASGSDADDRTRQELFDENIAYERRFGHVFLIRAAGRSPAEMLIELNRRIASDAASERRKVADQLAQITQLRLERLLDS